MAFTRKSQPDKFLGRYGNPTADSMFRLRHCVAGSSISPSRIEFVILRTGLSLSVALHPASQRRSYFQLHIFSVDVKGTFTPLTSSTHQRTTQGIPALNKSSFFIFFSSTCAICVIRGSKSFLQLWISHASSKLSLS